MCRSATLNPRHAIVSIVYKCLVNVSTLANVIMFADDMNLFFCDTKVDNLVKKLIRLELISRQFKLNKLSLNIKQTNFLLFDNKRSKTNATPTMTNGETKIDQVSKTKNCE